jgi:dihydroflavonol-4-reductase
VTRAVPAERARRAVPAELPRGAACVTGATGFVGSALVRRLAARGDVVHALARPTSDRSFAADWPVTWHAGDVCDPASLDRAIGAFADAARAAGLAPDLVHGAAQLGYATGGGERMRRVNVEGTRCVLDACRAHGVRRVVHVSSVVAVGPVPDARHELDEDAPFDGARLLVDYVTTKRAAEDFALAVADQLDVVAVNPGAIFGVGPAPTNSTLLVQSVANRRVGSIAPPGGMAVVGVDDVAAGIELALARGQRGRRYILTERNLTHRELIGEVAALLDLPPPRVTAPRWAWRLLAALAVPVDRVRPLRAATPQALRMLGTHWRFRSRRAREELGWSPRPFGEVLRETVAGMRERGWLRA